MLNTRRCLELEGLIIDRISLASTLKKIDDACQGKKSLQIVTLNLNFITLARHNLLFRKAINDADIVVPDGRFIIWIANFIGEPFPEQITGHDLMRECLALGRKRGYRMFLLGGKPGIAKKLCQKLSAQLPEMKFAGMSGGLFSETGENVENVKILSLIRNFKPHFLFVALGAPKQDVWISKHLGSTDARVAVGVGGVFDTLVGDLPRAPKWMQVLGLESLFQLSIEPKRYWRRYLVDDPPTLFRLVSNIIRRKF
jgi:N-acetylglucosaminyldiphosphoundecaprenol N-acetyl-beta-D-mannosaminyltransferase